MYFEKISNNDGVGIKNWYKCTNCGYNGDPPPSAKYRDRLKTEAAERNADLHGKSCVTG